MKKFYIALSLAAVMLAGPALVDIRVEALTAAGFPDFSMSPVETRTRERYSPMAMDAAAMGAGYVPRMVSVALVGIGAILVVRGTLRSRTTVGFPAFSWRIIGLVLGAVYAVASLAQVVVGRLIDRWPLKPLWLAIVLAQVPMLGLAAVASGWWAWLALLGSMIFIFGAIPFTDATIVRYVDDRMRSRVAGMRLAVSLAISSSAVWALGPAVKAAGFATLFVVMAGVSLVTAAVLSLLPAEPSRVRSNAA